MRLILRWPENNPALSMETTKAAMRSAGFCKEAGAGRGQLVAVIDSGGRCRSS